MSVANLTRYSEGGCECGRYGDDAMYADTDGEWVKFEEAVEASSNSLQQLKAEIRAISEIIEYSGTGIIQVDFAQLKQRLRELSAV